MPNPKSDRDQIRFAQIRGRMVQGITKNCTDAFLKASNSDRASLADKLAESAMIMEIIDCCAYEAQCIEESRPVRRR